MKNQKYIIILLTAITVSFMLGLFLGRYQHEGSFSVLVDHKPPSAGKVDLNKGTMDEFCMLPGISEIMAQRIIDYREKFGPFKEVDELCMVSGISKSKLDELRSYLKVEE